MSAGKKKHNLLFIDSGFGYGGTAVFLYEFLHRLNREIFNPSVAFYYPTVGEVPKSIKDLGIEVISLGMKPEENYSPAESGSQVKKRSVILAILRAYSATLKNFFQQDLLAAFRIAQFVKRGSIELVVLNNDLHYHVPGVLAAKLAKVRCVCRKAGIGGGRKMKKILGRFVDVYWSISQATTSDQTRMKVPTKRLVTFYEGIDIQKYDPTTGGEKIRKELNLSPGMPIIGSISRLEAGKGHRELIQAARLVIKEFPEVVFLIVGDDLEFNGLFREKLRKEAMEQRVIGNLIFTGWRTDIPNILAGVDIFVHCPNTFAEGLPRAAAEAMAMGKPTIVTDNSGLKETTEDKVTGFVVPRGDVLALSHAILALLKDRKLASDMGKRARLRAERLFDIRKNVRQAEKLFLELLA
jgi:glycosyltransferase involved in cell wall biosynthesis